MAKKKRRRIASRGSVNTIILKTLINGDKYGYEIIKEVEEYSMGKVILKQPSLYSSLSRFEDKGIVTSYWGDSDIGGRRHYYHLTEKGKVYYNHEILKINDGINIDDVENEEIERPSSNRIIDNNEEALIDEEEEIKEISDDEIPAIINFDVKEEQPVTPDHNFYTHTPLDNINQNSSNENTPTQIVEERKEKPWEKLSNIVKKNNKKCANSPNKKFHYIEPKRSQKVILDTDGIYKLRDADYQPVAKTNKQKIIDNVGKRINPTMYGYNTYTDKINEQKDKTPVVKEMTEEERRARNENFLNKFNTLTKRIIDEKEESKPKHPPIISKPNKPVVEDIDPRESIEYRNKLNKIMETNDTYEEEVVKENNLFNYVDEEDNSGFDFEEEKEENEEDKFIDFEPVEFETKNENKQYIEEINNYTAKTETVKMSRYESNAPIQQEKSYLLINKVRLVFGIILGVILLSELTAMLFIFKNLDLFYKGDNILFIVAYSLVIILAIAYIMPFIFNPNNHKLNTFKLKYSILFGILTFLVSLVLIYCVNALGGFELDNFKYFAVKLIVPAVLAFNFVIGPIIYNLIVKSKKFYD